MCTYFLLMYSIIFLQLHHHHHHHIIIIKPASLSIISFPNKNAAAAGNNTVI